MGLTRQKKPSKTLQLLCVITLVSLCTRFSYKLRFVLLSARIRLKKESSSPPVEEYRMDLENAANYAEVWEIVKDTVEHVFHKRRGNMITYKCLYKAVVF